MEAIPTLEELQARLDQFRDDRDWRQFHTLKDLAASISIEASELQALFLWSRSDEEVLGTRRQEVEAETEILRR